ncbi:unnamed protein product [Parnassius mnemosyne]|uniref:Transposase n=1 Tax=Parnassius mnemosyne TaxID=213953 RepID=A0AAV1LNR0_9NEOP
MWQIAEELQISKERVGEILHEHLNMRKNSARWVPKMLTPLNKQLRLASCKDVLELVGDNKEDVWQRIVTVDEKWIRQYDTESKQEPLQWVREAIVQKRRGKLTRGVLFLQDNAPVHTAHVARQALKDTGFSEIDHPLYSPDLAPSDFFPFSNLKKDLRSRRFADHNEMKTAVDRHFEEKDTEYFLGGLKVLYARCEKCITLEGDYIEK